MLDRESFPSFYNCHLRLKPVTMTSTPKTMQAIKIVSAGKAEIQSVPLPKLLDHYVLVKVTAVAVNPTDWYESSSDTDKSHAAHIYSGSISTGPSLRRKAPRWGAISLALSSLSDPRSRRIISLAIALLVSRMVLMLPEWTVDASATIAS